MEASAQENNSIKDHFVIFPCNFEGVQNIK